MDKKYYVYILLTEGGSYYCGYTDNVEKRFQKHAAGKGAKYTRSHKPVKIAWYKEYTSKSEAMSVEKKIKSLTHKEKQNIINSQKDSFRFTQTSYPFEY